MSHLLLHKKNNPCPVCGGHDGCKTDTTTARVLCRGNSSNPNYSLLSTKGQWGVYLEASKVVNPKELTEADRAAYYATQDAHRHRARQQAKLELSKLIPIAQRTEEIASILSELELYSKHASNLTSRNLDPRGIELGSFRSIRKYQEFSREYSLPGFIKNKYVGETGFLCPAKDARGRWVGFQIHSDDKLKGKYKWTAHTDRGVSVSAKLREFNEYPMNVVHKSTSNFIGICEGMLKPFVASQRHGLSLIGYAGGQFSPKYLLTQLKLINPQKKLPVVIIPDKGTITNKGWVFQLNQRYIEVLVNNGYQVKVADWGHWASKDGCDIDELPNLDKLSLRDIDYFEACRQNLPLYIDSIDFGLDKESALRIVPEFIASLIQSPKLTSMSSRGKLKLVDHGEFEPLPRTGLPEFLGRAGSYEFECNSADVYRDAIDLGYSVVLDISGTGTGKTTSATLLELEDKERLFYLTTESRNPNHERLETDFRELPARNQGYVYDAQKATPTGRPQRKIPKDGEVPSTVGNCHWTDKFIALRNCNSTVNPCSLCTREYFCMSSTGDGHGYKYQTRYALGGDRIIANPQGISDTMIRNRDIGIVDEYSQSVEWLKKTEVRLDDVADLKQRFISDTHHTAQYKLMPLLNAVSNLLTDDMTSRWGLSTQDIIGKLAVIPQEDLLEIKPIIKEIVSDYNKQVILQNKREGRYGLEVLFVKEWVFLLVDILCGDLKNSSLALVNGTLSIVVKNQRTIDNLTKFSTVIFQDATGSREDLALRLGVPAHEILVIRKVDPIPLNLVIHHVIGCGRLGNQRRKKAQDTVAILRQVFDKRHKEVGYIDYKKYAKPGDLHHHSDARGSNLFANKRAVVSFGVPCANLGAVQREYEALTGDRVYLGDEGLQFFINSKVIAEILQEIGRIRANRRRNDQLHYYFCGDINTDFLQELGFNVVKEDAVNLDIKAGNTQQIARFNLINAFKKTVDLGNDFKNITQQKLAEQAKLAQNSISYMSKAFDGWEQLKRVLSALLCDNKEQFNTSFGDLTEADIYLANSYLPEVFKLDFKAMCTELQGIIIAYGETKLHQLLDNTPVESLVEFLRSIYLHLPFYYQKRFLYLCKDC